MRQAGLKPKNHSSGVYWIRASSGNGKKESREENTEWGIIGILFFIILMPFVLIMGLIERLSKK